MPNHSPGRNDPCPCGSGRKYKLCCLKNQPASAAPSLEELQKLVAEQFPDYRTNSKFLFITALLHVLITDDLSPSEVNVGAFKITNNKPLIHKFCDPYFVSQIGPLEAGAIQRAKAVACFVGKGPLQPDAEMTNAHLFRILTLLRHYLHALWLIKDNSVNFEQGFMLVVRPTLEQSVHSNFMSGVVTTAEGQRIVTQFSRQELKQASSLLADSIFPLMQGKTSRLPGETSGLLSPHLLAQGEIPRPLRAWAFLDSARATQDLGVKVATYCTILECLFSTDAAEISHKIAHRVSIFLGDTLPGRKATYQKVREAYQVRSKVVHGDTLGEKQERGITRIAKETDQLLREVMLKILTNKDQLALFQADKKQLDAFFLDSSLSVGPLELKSASPGCPS